MSVGQKAVFWVIGSVGAYALISQNAWLMEKFTTEFYDFEVCNHSFQAQSSTVTSGKKSMGRATVMPGNCHSFQVIENSSFWHNGKKHRIEDANVQTKFVQTGYEDFSLAEANEAYQRIQGVARYKATVADRSVREPAFTFGLGLAEDATLSHVVPGMPGYLSGMQPGDRIVALDGKSINNRAQFATYMDNIWPGRTTLISVTIEMPDGEIRTGAVQPDFFPTNHWHYREGGGKSAFFGHLLDGVTFGFMSDGNPNFQRKLQLDQFIYGGASSAGSVGSFFVGGSGALKIIGRAGKGSKGAKAARTAKSAARLPLASRVRNFLDRSTFGKKGVFGNRGKG